MATQLPLYPRSPGRKPLAAAPGGYHSTCGFGFRCSAKFTGSSPYVVIKRLRQHLEEIHENECPLCPWRDETPGAAWAHLEAHRMHKRKDTKKNTVSPLAPTLKTIICPDRDWQSNAMPADQADAAYQEHCLNWHDGGLACAFCGQLFPGWGSLAWHVVKQCDRKPRARVSHPLSGRWEKG